MTGLQLADGSFPPPADAVAVGLRRIVRAEAFSGLGITATEHPMGSCIAMGELGRAAVSGAWVAGNATDLSAQVGAAAAEDAAVAVDR